MFNLVGIEKNRYARFELINWWKQDVLSKSKVLVVGCVGKISPEIMNDNSLAIIGPRELNALDSFFLNSTKFEDVEANDLNVTRQEFDVKQTERDLAAQGVARAEAHLRQSQAGARAAGTMADYTRITAPISGIITAPPCPGPGRSSWAR